MATKVVRKKRAGKSSSRKPVKKMKPAMVPVEKLSENEFAELSRFAEATRAQVPRLAPATVPYGTVPHKYFRQLDALRNRKKIAKKKKYRIYRMVLVKEFRATQEGAQKEMDRISARRKSKGVLYWLDEVQPMRRRPIRCK